MKIIQTIVWCVEVHPKTRNRWSERVLHKAKNELTKSKQMNRNINQEFNY